MANEAVNPHTMPIAPVYIKLGVFALLMAVWQGFAMLLDVPDLPSLTQTLQALYYHTHEGDLIDKLYTGHADRQYFWHCDGFESLV
jgi:ABC-type nitrate/sulfonate/bicarbonate transport system permease component